jgi:hypothetical protein
MMIGVATAIGVDAVFSFAPTEPRRLARTISPSFSASADRLTFGLGGSF